MKNFLYKHLQRVIGAFIMLIGIFTIIGAYGFIEPNEATNYIRACADDFRRYRFRGHDE